MAVAGGGVNGSANVGMAVVGGGVSGSANVGMAVVGRGVGAADVGIAVGILVGTGVTATGAGVGWHWIGRSDTLDVPNLVAFFRLIWSSRAHFFSSTSAIFCVKRTPTHNVDDSHVRTWQRLFNFLALTRLTESHQ